MVFGKDKNLQTIIAQNNRDPFFIIEQNGEIITSNPPGTSLLKLETNPGKITQYFDKETADNFEQLLEQAVELNVKLEVELTELTLRGGEKINAELLFNCYEAEKNLFIFCTVIPRHFEFDIAGEERITLFTGDLGKIVGSEKIKHVLDKIIDIYPLTFIGKETIQKLVNGFEEHFWIKDNKGKFLLVNNAYAESLGLRSFQMEGKSFFEFIPGYLIDFFDAIDKYIRETLNCIIIDAFPITRMRSDADKEILELPLSDNDRNVVALVGISREKVHIPIQPSNQDLHCCSGRNY